MRVEFRVPLVYIGMTMCILVANTFMTSSMPSIRFTGAKHRNHHLRADNLTRNATF